MKLKQDPPTRGWRGFLRTKAGQSMTKAERERLCNMIPPEDGRGFSQRFYRRTLEGLRNRPTADVLDRCRELGVESRRTVGDDASVEAIVRAYSLDVHPLQTTDGSVFPVPAVMLPPGEKRERGYLMIREDVQGEERDEGVRSALAIFVLMTGGPLTPDAEREVSRSHGGYIRPCVAAFVEGFSAAA